MPLGPFMELLESSHVLFLGLALSPLLSNTERMEDKGKEL